jgi:hypothetical protein
MSSKHDEYDDDEAEDDEEDEGDFVPGMDDDDDLDDDFEEENLDEEDDPFLKGHLYLNGGKIAFDGESFDLVSDDAQPLFSLFKPTLEKPAIFSGTLKDVAVKMKVRITKTDQTATIDPLEQRFLDQQAEIQPTLETTRALNSQSPVRAELGDIKDTDDRKAAPEVSPGDGKKVAAMADIYVLEASQVDPKHGGTTHEIRGLFRPLPASSTANRLFLMAIVQTSQVIGSASAAGAASPAKPATATRKRGRDDDDDEDDDGDDGVGNQELIDLYDDAGLSTEELRRRYYGGGTGDSEAKKPKTSVAVEESDDDDAYGF